MKKAFVLAILMGGIGTLQAQTTLLEDTFSGSGNLTGSVPDQSTSGNAWTGGTSPATATMSGGLLTVTAPASNSNLYDFQVTSGSLDSDALYTFTINLPQIPTATVKSDAGGWFNLGLDSIASGGLNRSIGSLQISPNGNGTVTGRWITNNGGLNPFVTSANNALLNSADGTEATITLNTGTGVASFYLGSSGASGTADYTFTYAPGTLSTTGLHLDLQSFTGGGDTNGMTFSVADVSITESVAPEPSALVLAAIGCAVLALVWRFRACQLV